MLKVLDHLPQGLLGADVRSVHQVLHGPTLIHLPGRREPALFVSVLLHGNEDTGLRAVQGLLRKHADRELPRAMSLLVGNVAAAREGVRSLPGQQDFNRVWRPGTGPEHAMAHQVCEQMRARRVFASVDVHNNTGFNPHYACINRLDHRFLHLAALFSRTVVYFLRPEGVQAAAFAQLCPAVTLECGQPGERYGVEHTEDYLEACLHLAAIPQHPVPAHDVDLFHSLATIKVPEGATLGFGDAEADVRLLPDLDRLNFAELPANTLFGWVRDRKAVRLRVTDERGADVGERYFSYAGNEIRSRVAFMPSMLTVSVEAVRQDCLGYVMERLAVGDEAVFRGDAARSTPPPCP